MLTALLVALSLTTATPATKTVTSAANGNTVAIDRGQRLDIDLSECGSCGYQWKTTGRPDRKVLKRRPNTHKDPTCAPPCTGGSDTVVFHYKGRAAGRTTIRLGYFGPGRSKPSKTFRLTVRVR